MIAPIPLHGGPLHALEWVVLLGLVLGPVAALVGAVVVVRRRDSRTPDSSSPSGDEAGRPARGGSTSTTDTEARHAC